MGKRRRHSSDSSLAIKKALLDINGISKLPDDILVNIINRLDLREAARTSLLSSRWKYLWTFTSHLNFDTPWTLRGITKRSDLVERRHKYISWVSKVLELHRASRLTYFKIHFDLRDSHKTIITDWIDQAVAKNVQKLDLDFGPCLIGQGKLYTFPQEWHNIIRSPPFLAGIRSLTALSLAWVDIAMETLEFFIYNCPLLERVQLKSCWPLLSGALKLVGSSIPLKYLDIDCCLSLTEIEISAAPSLLSFKYFGQQIKLNIENVPRLVDVSIGGSSCDVGLENLIDPIRSYLIQLETLELHLNLNRGSDSERAIQLTDIIKACPFLYKFTLKTECIGGRRRREVHEFPKCSHQHLKVLELIGFRGDPIELEFAFYILKNAINLEKIIVNPEKKNPDESTHLEFGESRESREKIEGREEAKQLKESVPQGVEFILL